MTDPNAYENERFLYRIRDIEILIQESLKLYDKNTDGYFLKEIESMKVTLARLETEHDVYKRNKVTIPM
jgi:hypothetical protein